MRPRPCSWLLPVLAASGSAGCGGGSPPQAHGGIDLLARTPDLILEQPGVLVPEADAWRPYGQFGWERYPNEGWVWSTRTSAFLELPALAPRERTLRLTLRGPDDKPRTLQVKLNGVALGEIPLPSAPAEQHLSAPAPAWREGENLLELAVLELAPRPDGKPAVGFGLSRVAYDEPARARIQRESPQAVLERGTALGYRLEPLASSRLELGGRARGEGELRLSFLRADRQRGEPWTEVSWELRALADEELRRSIPLPEVAGDLLEFRLTWRGEERSRFELADLRLEELEPVERFPIVLVVIDTLSARHLSLQGYPLPTSPRLERFARDAIVFERCLANAPWTLPSFMSLVTGLLPDAHRLRTGSGESELWEQWYLSSNRWTLAEFLRAAGWRTAAFVDNFWITERFGFSQGFELYDSSAGDIEKTDPDGGIRHVLNLARGFLADQDPAEPVFLFLHAFDVHGPYTPTRPFRGSFPPTAAPYDLTRTAPSGGPAEAYGIIPTYIARGEVEEGPLPPTMSTAPLARAYDEGIAMVDAELGAFFDWLEERGLLERALVIVTADHGETLAGEGFLFGHGVLDEDVLHVPLVVRLPGGRGGGRRIEEPVQLLDLYPTLLDLSGSHSPRQHLHGRSFVPLLEGRTRPRKPILCEGGLMNQSALYARGWKFVERKVGASPPAVLLSFQPLTREWMDAAEDRLRQKGFEESALAWREDEELVADLFERLPRSGLTEELLARMSRRAGFEGLIRVLRAALASPRQELYDLAADPEASRDLFSARPGLAWGLARFLRAEEARGAAARAAARPPTQTLELSREDLQALRDLGYGGK